MWSARRASRPGLQHPVSAIASAVCSITRKALRFSRSTERIQNSDAPARLRISAGEGAMRFLIKYVVAGFSPRLWARGNAEFVEARTRAKARDYIFILVAAISFAAQPGAAQSTSVREFVSTYCITCHSDRLKTGGLSLEKADTENVF